MLASSNKSAAVRVALLWHAFGHNNLGVDALSRANAAIIEAAAARLGMTVDFVTLGSGQKADVPDLPPNVVVGPRPRIRELTQGRSEFLAALRTCQIAIDIGEGDSFSDIYGRQRFGFHAATKLASILLRQPLVLAPQTIGPFDHPLHRRIAVWLMNRASAVYARDHLSMAFLKNLGVRAPCEEFVDVAFRLPFTPAPKIGEKIRIGLNVSGLLYNGGYTGANELGMALDYKALTHQLIEKLLAFDGSEVELFAHVAGDGGQDDDGPVIEELGRRYPGTIVTPRFSSSIAAKSYMSGLDFVIAGRMHACIGAFSAGVPVAPIAYSRKFNGLFGTLNYPFFIDGKATTTEKALSDLLDWFARRVELTAAIEAARPTIDARLENYESRLSAILAQLTRAERSA